MCGIVGFVGHHPAANRDGEAVVQSMASTLESRGPDDSGTWADPEAEVWLGHRRLSVVDLSNAGHQPMASPSGAVVAVYNGEIYNHLELRDDLPDVRWRGHSDTETLVHAVEAWGVERTLDRLVGMFAFAVWDRRRGELTIARDRFGEKPLYYGWYGGTFMFASELKALRRHPGFEDRIDPQSVALYLQHSAVPGPHSIVKQTRKLPPGSLLTVRPGAGVSRTRRYWDPVSVAAEGLSNPLRLSDGDALAMVEEDVGRAVRAQLVADVPVGVFLSGGTDSSLVLALTQRNAGRSLKSFTIGFEEATHNEADYAREVAAYLGSDHLDMVVSPRDAMEVLPTLPSVYDEPFGDSSAVPTLLVSQLARRSVTVALTGDGADELFGGYNRHVWGNRVRRLGRSLPAWVRRHLAGAVEDMRGASIDRVFAAFSRVLPSRLSFTNFSYKLNRLAPALAAEEPIEFYESLALHWNDVGHVVQCLQTRPRQPWPRHLPGARLEETMMLMDLMTYLPNDILVKTDRAAMSVGLETRAPFLDHRLAASAWRLPLEQKIRGGEGKWVLRRLLERLIPAELVRRPKMGFGLPMGEWLRGPLRDWAEALLNEDCLKEQGILNPGPIRRRWDDHLRGVGRAENDLWDVLMFQAWYQDWRSDAFAGR